MRISALLVVSCFLAASPLMAASAADRSHAFPPALQGEWNPVPFDCKEAQEVANDMRFEIAGPLRGNFEDIETISSVVQVADSPDAWRVVTISNVVGSGEGQARIYVLGRKYLFVTDGDRMDQYVRCSQN